MPEDLARSRSQRPAGGYFIQGVLQGSLVYAKVLRP